jgi:transcriptional regulator with XRE-family HTH domain
MRLADISGLSLTSVQTFANGKHSPSADTLDRLKDAIKTELRLREIASRAA